MAFSPLETKANLAIRFLISTTSANLAWSTALTDQITKTEKKIAHFFKSRDGKIKQSRIINSVNMTRTIITSFHVEALDNCTTCNGAMRSLKLCWTRARQPSFLTPIPRSNIKAACKILHSITKVACKRFLKNFHKTSSIKKWTTVAQSIWPNRLSRAMILSWITVITFLRLKVVRTIAWMEHLSKPLSQ